MDHAAASSSSPANNAPADNDWRPELKSLRENYTALFESVKATDAVFRKAQQYLEERLALESELRHRAEVKLAIAADQLSFILENDRAILRASGADKATEDSYDEACSLLQNLSAKCADLDLEVAKQKRLRKELEARLWKAERAAAFRQTLSSSAVMAAPLLGDGKPGGSQMMFPSLETLAALRTDIVALQRTLAEMPPIQRPFSA